MNTSARVLTIDSPVQPDTKTVPLTPATPGRGELRLAIDVGQSPWEPRPAGTFRVTDGGTTLEAIEFGVLQTADTWASLSARVRMRPSFEERSAVVIIEFADPFVDGRPPTVTITLDGRPYVSGVFKY
jgi:hypothetical protein